MVVRLVRVMFRDRTVPVEIAGGKMEIVQKGKGKYMGIELVEILWKVCAVVINCWLKRSVMLHNTIHVFRTGRGTGTETLESNMAQQLMELAHEPLFQVILNLRKAYNSLDQ